MVKSNQVRKTSPGREKKNQTGCGFESKILSFAPTQVVTSHQRQLEPLKTTIDLTYLTAALDPFLYKELANIVYGYLGNPFISTWRVDGDHNLTVSLPLEANGMFTRVIPKHVYSISFMVLSLIIIYMYLYVSCVGICIVH